MATIKDIASAAGVSVATVSRVMNNGPKVGKKTRARVHKIMTDMGYRPNANARALVTRQSSSLGVVIPDLTDPFFAALAGGIDRVARSHQMQLLLSTGSSEAVTERQALESLLERRCDQVVMNSKAMPDDELIAYAQAVPGLVLINRFIEAIGERCVYLDNRAGGELAARHLISMGHRQVACIASEYNIDDPVHRLEGFSAALAQSGIHLGKDFIEYSQPNQAGGESAMRNLLARGKQFSAVFVYNDSMASGVISTLQDNGLRVPEDISVIGFDDVLFARYQTPRLTTLRYPIELMAERAAELALSLASGTQYEGQTHRYQPTLVVRNSVAAASNQGKPASLS